MNEPALYSESYDKSQFTKTWDASTVIEYIVKLISSKAGITGKTNDIKILAHRARLFSALKAFTGESCEDIESYIDLLIESDIDLLIDMCIGRNISKNTISEIKDALVVVERGKEWDVDYLKKQSIDHYFICGAFRTILMYRVEINKAMKVYSGVSEASGGYYLGMMKAESIYNSLMKEANQKIDSILALLLGDDFKKTFSEIELIEKYNYPTITDAAIRKWILENYKKTWR